MAGFQGSVNLLNVGAYKLDQIPTDTIVWILIYKHFCRK